MQSSKLEREHEEKSSSSLILEKNIRSKYYIKYFRLALGQIENHINNNFFTESAREDIAFGLIAILDEYAIKFINHEIGRYRNERNVETKLTPENALKELNSFYIESNDLSNSYPAYEPLLQNLASNFANKMIQLIERLNDDFELINKAFDKSGHDLPTKISRIIQTGSDLHRQGGQVLILKLINERGYEAEFVYKPSSIEADAFIVGDLKRLSSLDSTYLHSKSFIEILNEELILKNNITLPTYLIIPRKCSVDGVIDRYGYIEFISHRPWQNIDCEEYLKDLVTRIPSTDIDRIMGLLEVPLDVIEKNRSYSIFRIKNNKPVPYKLDLKMLEEGISSTLEIFDSKKEELLNWFEQIKSRDIYIRYIPLNTTELAGLRDSMINDFVSTNDSYNATINRFTNQLLKIKKTPQTNQDVHNDSIFNEKIVSRLVVELAQGNIPVYFNNICGLQLFDFNDQAVPTYRPNSRDFFIISSFQNALNRFENITRNFKATESTLIEELHGIQIEEETEGKEFMTEIDNIRNLSPDRPSSSCCSIM